MSKIDFRAAQSGNSTFCTRHGKLKLIDHCLHSLLTACMLCVPVRQSVSKLYCQVGKLVRSMLSLLLHNGAEQTQ